MNEESLFPDAISTYAEVADRFRKHPDTTGVSIVGIRIISIASLFCFENLQSLSVQGFYCTGHNFDSVSDFTVLPEFSKLVELDIFDCKHFDNAAIESVSHIPNLQTLTISSFMHTITDLTPLASLSTLRKLDLSGYPGITNAFDQRMWWYGNRRGKIHRKYLAERDRQLEIVSEALPNCEIKLFQAKPDNNALDRSGPAS